MVSNEQIRQFQEAQKLIEKHLKADLVAVWGKVKSLDPSVASGVLQQAISQLVDKYGLMAGAVAADWFEQLTGETAVVPDSYRVQAWEASVRWAVSDLFTADTVNNAVKRAVFERLSSVAVRHVRQHGRDTIDSSVRARDGVLYARRPSGVTCDFCLLMASRGPVYGTRRDAGGDGNRYHSDCDCVPVPVKGRWLAGRWVGETPGYDFEKLHEEEYKPYWRGNDDIRDVIKRRRGVLARTHPEKKQGRPRKGTVDTSKVSNLRDHEFNAANLLAQSGLNVVFRSVNRVQGAKNPDIEIDGVVWEIKSPQGSGKNTIANQFSKARKQANRLVLDLSRCALSEEMAVSQAEHRFFGQSKIVEMIIIGKQGKVNRYSLLKSVK